MAAPDFVAPHDFERWSPALRGAYRRGWNDAMAGNFRCPYSDKRKRDGRITWSRAFVKAWEDGAASAISERGAE